MHQSQHLEPGTVVRFKGNPLGYLNRYAIVVEHDWNDCVFLQTEGSDRALVARHEVVVPRNPPTEPLRFLRHRMPYGKWTCADGREVLFNRDYKPLWQRYPGQAAHQADSGERVNWMRVETFYTGANQPWRDTASARMCSDILAKFGVRV
jgi:hypothetical protein